VAKRRNGKSEAEMPVSAPTTDARERDKDFLSESEIDRLLSGTRRSRHDVHDYLLIMMYRHGLSGPSWRTKSNTAILHSCGYYLADKGTDLRTMQDYLGHRDPRHTVHYTRIAGSRFEGLWKR
jgi:hypothetical protein